MKTKVLKITSLAIALLLMVTCFVSCSTSYIDSVKYGSPNDYPDLTWGEQLDSICPNGEWSEFVADDGRYIVEYNGTTDSDNTICIQFEILEDEGGFEVCYMDLDEEECGALEIAEFITLLFEGYDY